MRITTLLAATAVAFSLAACKDDKEEEASAASCTQEQLQEKAEKLAAAIQADPSKAANLASKMQELAPRFQEILANTDGEPDQKTLDEICVAYDGLLAEL